MEEKDIIKLIEAEQGRRRRADAEHVRRLSREVGGDAEGFCSHRRLVLRTAASSSSKTPIYMIALRFIVCFCYLSILNFTTFGSSHVPRALQARLSTSISPPRWLQST